tara:strand:- start:93 stop:350 length:258 start_codon:yes stop_codon:yes gene_type:complete
MFTPNDVPKQLSENVFFDKSEQLVVVYLDRVSVSLDLSEFLEFLEELDAAKEKLISDSDIAIGTYEDGEKIKKQFIILPDAEDIN